MKFERFAADKEWDQGSFVVDKFHIFGEHRLEAMYRRFCKLLGRNMRCKQLHVVNEKRVWHQTAGKFCVTFALKAKASNIFLREIIADLHESLRR